MKRIASMVITFFLCVISLSSCYQDFYYDSLGEYITRIEQRGVGYSQVEIDYPDYFLPIKTFASDFEFVDGGFHYYEEDLSREIFEGKREPEIAILYLRYCEDIYENAKKYMLNNIPRYGEKTYIYKDYIFYENANFISLHGRRFPKWFTMACYNDEKHTLMFIGFYDGYPGLSSEEQNNIEENWGNFLETYYGKYYNFDE